MELPMSEFQVPADLMRVVERDLRPVRPLPPPWRRAIAFVPLALGVLALMTASWRWRLNVASLGPRWAWDVSIVQAALGFVVFGAALREAVPGRNLSRRAILATFGGAAVVVVAVTLGTSRTLPTVMPPGVWLRYAWECWGMSMVSGLPVFALAAWLVARALPTRPALAGALCGLGVGVLADSALRLFCWVSSPAHVLLSHGGAIVTLVLAGMLVTTALDRWIGRRRRSEPAREMGTN
jgi:hypothetical protein